MKKTLLSFVFAVAMNTLAWSQIPATFVDVDCSSVEGFSFVIKAPSAAKPVEKYGSLYLSDDKKYQIEVGSEEGAPSLEKLKAEINGNTMNVLKKYVIDEPAGILYETDVFGTIQYHFVYQLKTADGYFEFVDTKGVNYTLAEAKIMYEAAKSSKLK
jgi:hypothetical protein